MASNLLDKSAAETITALWTFTAEILLENNKRLTSKEIGGSVRNLILIDGGDITNIGSNELNSRLNGNTEIDFRINGTAVSRGVDRVSGGLLLFDIGGTLKKAGFRNPTAVTAGGTRDLAQSDEGRILLASNVSATYTAVTLEAFTTMRFIVSATGVTIVPDAGVTMNFLDGLGSAQPAVLGVDVARNSVVELVYQTATFVQVFGNGITVTS